MAAYTIVASGNNTRASAPCSSGEEGTQPGTFQIGRKGAAQNNMSSLHTITSLGCSIFHVVLRRIDPVGFSGLHGSIRGVSGLRASPKVRLPLAPTGQRLLRVSTIMSSARLRRLQHGIVSQLDWRVDTPGQPDLSVLNLLIGVKSVRLVELSARSFAQAPLGILDLRLPRLLPIYH